jgi:hypothetical protein
VWTSTPRRVATRPQSSHKRTRGYSPSPHLTCPLSPRREEPAQGATCFRLTVCWFYAVRHHLPNFQMIGRESSFSEFSVLSQQRQLSPMDPLPTPFPCVPKESDASWRLEGALDRLNAPIPHRVNVPVEQDPGNPESSQPLNRSKRRADPPTPQPKRVKLSSSVTESSDFKAPPSIPGSYNLPLCGVVVFVDSKKEGTSTSKHWGDILHNLGAQVCRSLCIRVFYIKSQLPRS